MHKLFKIRFFQKALTIAFRKPKFALICICLSAIFQANLFAQINPPPPLEGANNNANVPIPAIPLIIGIASAGAIYYRRKKKV